MFDFCCFMHITYTHITYTHITYTHAHTRDVDMLFI
jgi:hypothetical protein